MLLFNAKNLFHQKYSRQKVVDRDGLGNDSLATRLLQLAAQWTTCVGYTEKHRIRKLACRLMLSLSAGTSTAIYIKKLHWLPMKHRVL